MKSSKALIERKPKIFFIMKRLLRKSFFINLATLSRRLDFRGTGLSLGREDRLMVCESIVAFWRGIFQLVVAEMCLDVVR